MADIVKTGSLSYFVSVKSLLHGERKIFRLKIVKILSAPVYVYDIVMISDDSIVLKSVTGPFDKKIKTHKAS